MQSRSENAVFDGRVLTRQRSDPSVGSNRSYPVAEPGFSRGRPLSGFRANPSAMFRVETVMGVRGEAPKMGSGTQPMFCQLDSELCL